ncbi:MAG: metabolite traffic protein EboE [Acidobacteria bacterium]|nr:metabolite traffic protein EboE [Acidobacteriota bacterium]
MSTPQPLHLTYCTNIHAADGWTAVRATIGRYAPALKARLSPAAPFGIGLRLSARDASELSAPRALDEFRAFLDREGLYVALINGFPYGAFHGTPVKADVYAPDWRTDERVAYTTQLVDILAALVPPGVDGGVSTVPLSYKPWMAAAAAEGWERLTANVLSIAERLIRLRADGGPVIHLDIEPEPDCVLENTAETLDFFERRLVPAACATLSPRLGMPDADVARAVLDHVRLCFDCCHFSVAHEDPIEALDRLLAAGIRIGRVQLSSALRLQMPADVSAAARVAARLRPFADSTYLHQVICRHDRTDHHYADLDAALDRPPAGEWRIHFHVPLFTGEYDGLQSTQSDVRRVLAAAATRALTSHLEIETYTWEVLPAPLKIDLLESIAREYDWVRGELAAASARPSP